MLRNLRFLLVAAVSAVALTAAPAASADIGPPWCGTPVPDAAANLPDGSSPTHPVGSFPHIPYYAIKCTLDSIAAQSNGRMTVEVMGHSALGRELYLVTFNALDTGPQRAAYNRWKAIRSLMVDNPATAMKMLEAFKGNVKIPVYVQGAIHGNEYEGVEANFETIHTLATTPYGEDPAVDAVLDHTILLFNVIQNPDGRVAGTRANGNGFDLNRDFLTQSQPETKASVAVMQEWLPPEVLDLHGYVTPTLIEATTKPHNPSIEYDMWLKWNQPRIDHNEAELNAIGYGVTRPINDWCPEADEAGPDGVCDDGSTPGPAVAEGWDDWGPFYTPMYAQHIGLDGSTVEMCNSTGTGCLFGGDTGQTRGRLASRIIQESVIWSTLEYVIEHRAEMMRDHLEIYRRGVTDAPRPECCPPPFDVANNWMVEYGQAYVIPMGAGQRSDAEANRLVEWLLFNGIEVHELRRDAQVGSQRFAAGSYVVWLKQARRGLADTALGVGRDISNEISRLYAPPAAWSHGFLWGADVVPVPDGVAFDAKTKEISEPRELSGGVSPGAATAYGLRLNSPTAVRVLNSLLGDGVAAQFATQPAGSLPAGSAVFAADAATRSRLDAAGRENGVAFERIQGAPAGLEPIDRSPRIAVLTGAVNQDVWSLRNLGFPADPVSTATINSSVADPLESYDVVLNAAGWPSAAQPTARARLTAFFARGGGYIGSGVNGAAFLTSAGQVVGLTAASRGGSGRSGIVNWENQGVNTSPITGAYPARDTAIMDPPAWFTSLPASFSADGRLPAAGILASGLWLFDALSASAPGSAWIAHGTNTAGTARMTTFSANPLYRADPEREWPMLASAALWADQ